MTEKVTIRDFEGMQHYAGDCSPAQVEFFYGELAVDLLGYTTAAELIVALARVVGAECAKTIVGLLLDHGLLFDSTLESEIPDAR